MKPDQKQQAQFDVFLLQARKSLYNDAGIEAFQSKLGQGDPPLAIGHTAAMLTQSVKGGIEQKGKTVRPEIATAAYGRLVNDLTEVAVAAKAVPEPEAPAVAQQAYAKGAEILRQKPEQQGSEPAQESAPPAPGGQMPQIPTPQTSGLAEQAMRAV